MEQKFDYKKKTLNKTLFHLNITSVVRVRVINDSTSVEEIDKPTERLFIFFASYHSQHFLAVSSKDEK